MANIRSAATSERGTAHRGRFPWLVVAAAAVQIAVVWLPAVPLGVPGEWTWSRISYETGRAAELFLGLLIAAPFAAGYVVVCRRLDPADRGQGNPILWRLSALVAAGFAWLWVVQETAPEDYNRLGRAPLVIFYPSFSGYFTEARRADDLTSYLASYESFMAQGDVLHLGTHPPGLIVGQRLLIDLFEASPPLTRSALASRPASIRATTDLIGETQAGNPIDGPPTEAEQAEVWAAALIVQLAAAAAVIPLYFLVKTTASEAAAWRTACLWPLVPALAIFLPKSDALLPLFGLTTIALWFQPGGPGLRRAALAGGVFWLGMTVSLAMLPVGALAGLWTVQRIVGELPEKRGAVIRTLMIATFAAAGVFTALTIGAYFLFDLNLPAVWLWNYRNHAGFYAQYPRTYGAWLLVNPIETAFAIGLPIAFAAIVSAKSWIADRRSPVLAAACVLGLLWLSGKNSGEAARLWLFLMPWMLWGTATLWEGDDGRIRWRILLPLQIAASLATVVRVSGFGFEEFLAVGG